MTFKLEVVAFSSFNWSAEVGVAESELELQMRFNGNSRLSLV